MVALNLNKEASTDLNTKIKDLKDCSQENVWDNKEYTTFRKFLLDKQFLFGQDDNVMLQKSISIPQSFSICLSMSDDKKLEFEAKINLSLFKEEEFAICYLYMPEPINRSIDDIIFLKQAKWSTNDKELEWFLKDSEESKNCNKYKNLTELCFSALKKVEEIEFYLPEDRPKTKNMSPVFDFIELRDINPTPKYSNQNDEPPKPNNEPTEANRRLTRYEQIGLLHGDEGYKLIRSNKASDNIEYRAGRTFSLRFESRKYFKYLFASSSCIAFYSEKMEDIKGDWAQIYSKDVGKVDSLNDYITLDSEVPCIHDGIPMIIELCITRFKVLRDLRRRIDKSMSFGVWESLKEYFKFSHKYTRSDINELLLTLRQYEIRTQKAIWVTGGDYLDNIYKHNLLKEVIEDYVNRYAQSEFNKATIVLEIVTAVLTAVTVLLAIISLTDFG